MKSEPSPQSADTKLNKIVTNHRTHPFQSTGKQSLSDKMRNAYSTKICYGKNSGRHWPPCLSMILQSLLALENSSMPHPGFTRVEGEHENSSSVLILMLFVLSYETWMFLSLGLGWSEPLWTISRFVCQLFYGAASLALTAGSQGTHSQGVSRQVGGKHRGMHCFVLKPKQDYFFNFPNTLVAAW